MQFNLSLHETQAEESLNSTESSTSSQSWENGRVRLRILKVAAEFEELRQTWSAWSDSPSAGLDFFSIHLRHVPSAIRPHVMVVYRRGHPDCMLIGWLEQGPVTFTVGPFPLFRSNARVFRFVDGGFLGNRSRENCWILVRAIVESLQKQEADAAEFSQLQVDSPLCDVAGLEPTIFCREHFIRVQNHRYVTMPATFDEFLRRRSRKSRQQFRRYGRKLMRDFPGRVRFQSFGSDHDVEDFVREAEAITQKTYQRALGIGFINNAETREMLRAATQKKALRASVLYIDEQPVAYASGIVFNHTLYAGFTGYDPEFKQYCPGYQAQMHLIRESFKPNTGILRFDAGCGDVPYKRALFDSSWEEHPLWIFAPSRRGLRLHVLRAISTLSHSVVTSLLTRSSSLRKLKKMLYMRALREFQRKNLVNRGCDHKEMPLT